MSNKIEYPFSHNQSWYDISNSDIRSSSILEIKNLQPKKTKLMNDINNLQLKIAKLKNDINNLQKKRDIMIDLLYMKITHS